MSLPADSIARHSLGNVFRSFLEHGAFLFNATRLAPTEEAHVARYYEFMQPKSDDVVVDLGCGCGAFGRYLKNIDPSLTVINVVNDPALIEIVKANGETGVEADMVATPLPDSCADFVTFNESIGHAEVFSAFEEASRLLKEDGKCVIKDFSPTVKPNAGVNLPNWGYMIRPPSIMIYAAAESGLTLETVQHPTQYMQHWLDIMGSSSAAKESASKHDPAALPLRTVLYKFIKGAVRGN